MIRVITFDLDDTLWDVRPALMKAEAAQNDWLALHYPQAMAGLDRDLALARKRTLLKARPELAHNVSLFRRTYLELLLLDAGIPPTEAAGAAALAFGEFIARRNDVALFEFADSVLSELRRNHVLGALTNGNADVSKTPIGHHFDFAFKAEDVGAAKPEPELFLAALEHQSARPEEVVHVGDSHDHDIVGADRAGLRSVWLARKADGDGARGPGRDACGDDQQSALADDVITCLSELPDAIDRLNQRHDR